MSVTGGLARPVRRCVLVAWTVAALLATAGCGGESKQDVISRGDEICREANGRLAELEEPESISGLPDYAREARPIVDGAVDDLKGLDPPGEDREAFDRFIEKSVELTVVLRELDEADGASEERLQELNDRIQRISEESNEAAAEYGFEDCPEE
jgi:hypothetical protein